MLKYLLEKEFIQIMRNPFLPRFIFVFPVVVLLIFPLAANFEIKSLKISVVDNNHSIFSQRLIQKAGSTGYFQISDVSGSYQQALLSIETDKADIILEIPPDFEKDLATGQTGRVLISANTVNGIRGGLGSAYLASIVQDFSKELRDEHACSNPLLARLESAITLQFRYNPRLEYPVFMVPALMVMLLVMFCGFLPALNIISEKESGTMEQINVTPVKKHLFIISKLIPYWVIGFLVLTLCFGVAWLVYGLIPRGSLATIYAFALVFVLAFSGLGLVISNYARNIQQAMFMMFFFMITFILMSGLYTPINSMPEWAQMVSRLSPMRYFMQVMRLVYLKGSGFSDLHGQFLTLCGFAFVFISWAVLSYRKTS